MFVQETLKDHLCETLKILKTRNYNEEVSNQTTLQGDEMSKCTNECALKIC